MCLLVCCTTVPELITVIRRIVSIVEILAKITRLSLQNKTLRVKLVFGFKMFLSWKKN